MLDFENFRDRQNCLLQKSPVLSLLTSPDFLKEVNFHQRIATFGKTPPANSWSDMNVKDDLFDNSDVSLPYISHGYFADPYISSSAEYDLPTEVEELGIMMKQDTCSNAPSDKEQNDREYEEKQKLERRRMKNREAAHRCRRKKMEKITLLEDKVRALQSENARVVGNVKRLEKENAYLRSGCRRCPNCLSTININL